MKQLLTGTMPEKHGLLIAGLMLIFFSFSSQAQVQSNKVNGVVIGKTDSLPLQGVTVVVKGTKRATVTNIEGKFEITAAPGEVIQFSFIGYSPLEVPAVTVIP